MSTFDDVGPARTYAAVNGLAFDMQGNYCEACRAYHVGEDHQQAVPVECGAVGLQGFDVTLELDAAGVRLPDVVVVKWSTPGPVTREMFADQKGSI